MSPLAHVPPCGQRLSGTTIIQTCESWGGIQPRPHDEPFRRNNCLAENLLQIRLRRRNGLDVVILYQDIEHIC